MKQLNDSTTQQTTAELKIVYSLICYQAMCEDFALESSSQPWFLYWADASFLSMTVLLFDAANNDLTTQQFSDSTTGLKIVYSLICYQAMCEDLALESSSQPRFLYWADACLVSRQASFLSMTVLLFDAANNASTTLQLNKQRLNIKVI